MTATIWKFPLLKLYAQVVEMPDRAVILSAQLQGDVICLWAAVDPTTPNRQPRCIYIVGTGWPFPVEGTRFLNTVQMENLVWHIFYETLS